MKITSHTPAVIKNPVKPGTAKPDRRAKKNSGERDKVEIGRKSWTALVYTAGNDLLINGFEHGKRSLEKAGSTGDLNLLMDMVTPEDYLLKEYRKTADSKFYCIKAGGESPLLEKEPGLKVNSPEHLEKSLLRAMKQYPAEKYLIIAGGHGVGFLGLLHDQNDKSYMPLKDFRQALENAEKQAGVKKEQVVLGLDSCLMGQAEAAYELKDTAGFLVASPSTTGGDGWNFEKIFKDGELCARTPRQMAEKIVETSDNSAKRQETIAAYDLNLMPQVKSGMDELGQAVLKHPEEKPGLKKALEASVFYMNTGVLQYYRDLGDFCRRIAKSPEIQAKDLKTAARKLNAVLKNTVIKEAHLEPKYKGSTGISMYPAYCPPKALHNYPDHEKYRKNAIGRETCWAKAMSLILERPGDRIEPEGGKSA